MKTSENKTENNITQTNENITKVPLDFEKDKCVLNNNKEEDIPGNKTNYIFSFDEFLSKITKISMADNQIVMLPENKNGNKLVVRDEITIDVKKLKHEIENLISYFKNYENNKTEEIVNKNNTTNGKEQDDLILKQYIVEQNATIVIKDGILDEFGE